MGAPRAPLLQAREVVRAAVRRPDLPPRAARAAHRDLTAAHYRIVADRSKVVIDAKSSLHAIHTETDGLEGELDLDQSNGHVSFPVDRLRSGNPLEDRELRRRVDARHHPTITGVMTSMTSHGDADRYLVAGDITFRGVTRSYEEEMTLERLDDTTIKLIGGATFDIRDFGMEPPKILVLRVHPEVEVKVEIVAEQQG